MADFAYKNITVTGAESPDVAMRQAVTEWLRQFGEPTEPEIDALLAEVIAAEIAEQAAEQAKIDFRNLPGWASWTGQEAADYVHGAIHNGMTVEQLDAWIDANITGTTVSQILTSVRTAFKQLIRADLASRDVLEKSAQATMFLRDIVVK